MLKWAQCSMSVIVFLIFSGPDRGCRTGSSRIRSASNATTRHSSTRPLNPEPAQVGVLVDQRYFTNGIFAIVVYFGVDTILFCI